MRPFLATALVAAAALAMTSASFAADAAGNWKDPDNGAVLSFFDCGGDLCAKILTASKPGLKDDKNPDEAKRSQPLEGLAILDQTYAGYVTLPAPDKLQLKGCALLVFCKTVLFDKVAAAQ
jgi:uncharacterized protein (DUF2147 family)